MIWATILFAFVLGLLLALLFGALFGDRERIPGFVVVFLLFFLFAWAGSLWIGPYGPAILGVYWLPGLVVTLLIFLLIGAIAERSPRHYREVQAEIEAKQETEKYLGMAFWVLIAALVVAIIIAYLVT